MLIALSFNIKNRVAQLPLENAIDRLINGQIATQHIPGLALAVTQGDKILYTKGYGVASSSQPVTVQTQFFIASVSKSFTATAIMQLVKENGTPVLEHNGILSTFYTDVVLLPQDKYGIVLLYNITGLTQLEEERAKERLSRSALPPAQC